MKRNGGSQNVFTNSTFLALVHNVYDFHNQSLARAEITSNIWLGGHFFVGFQKTFFR